MSDPSAGSTPYGTIRYAISSGDPARLRQVSDNAHRWLAQNPEHPDRRDVEDALRQLEAMLGGRR